MILSSAEYRILGNLRGQHSSFRYSKYSKEESKPDLQQLKVRTQRSESKPASVAILAEKLFSPLAQACYELRSYFGLERESHCKRQERTSLCKISVTSTLAIILVFAAVSTSNKTFQKAPSISELLAMHK